MTSEPIAIRLESEADYAAVDAVHRAAFADDEDVPRIVERTRASDSYLPDLSLVAVRCVDQHKHEPEEVLGHVLLSRAWIDGGPVLALGPIGVLPEWQRRGIGSRLMRESIERARDSGESLIVLLGHPSYYPRFGFVRAGEVGVTGAWTSDPFMALALRDDHPRGRFEFPPAFDDG